MESWLPLITGSGGALVVLAIGIWMFITGKLHSDPEFKKVVEENEHLRTAIETERTTNNELARAGTVTTKVLDALVEVATSRREHEPQAGRKEIPPGDLTADDLGL